jgi:hypothetical protein
MTSESVFATLARMRHEQIRESMPPPIERLACSTCQQVAGAQVMTRVNYGKRVLCQGCHERWLELEGQPIVAQATVEAHAQVHTGPLFRLRLGHHTLLRLR